MPYGFWTKFGNSNRSGASDRMAAYRSLWYVHMCWLQQPDASKRYTLVKNCYLSLVLVLCCTVFQNQSVTTFKLKLTIQRSEGNNIVQGVSH